MNAGKQRISAQKSAIVKLLYGQQKSKTASQKVCYAKGQRAHDQRELKICKMKGRMQCQWQQQFNYMRSNKNNAKKAMGLGQKNVTTG